MKKYIMIIAILFLGFISSCKKDAVVEPTTQPQQATALTVQKVISLSADTNSTKTAAYFSLKDNKIVPASDSGSTNWDIGFYSSTIFTNDGVRGKGNGGAIVLKNTDFSTLKQAPDSGYLTETGWSGSGLAILTGSGNGWYNYDPATHLILPIPGVVLIIRTADGKYAKVKIDCYYKGNPDPASLNDQSIPRYYTFEFVYQPDGSKNF